MIQRVRDGLSSHEGIVHPCLMPGVCLKWNVSVPVQAALAYWSVVSPFSPYGPTIALVVILLVAAVKALIEDAGRHKEDVKINNGKTRVLHNNGTLLSSCLSACISMLHRVNCKPDYFCR